MYPVLLNIGPLAISSFGLFLSVGLLFAVFVIWRLANIYDIDQEKALDSIFLTFISGLVGARLSFWLLNLSEINTIAKIVLINKYPGLDIWGGVIMGFLSLLYLSKKFKFNFWLAADVAATGFFAGLAISSLGCLFAACQVGKPSDLFFAVAQVGTLGKRFPIQIIYSLVYFVSFYYLFKLSLKFHFFGKITATALIMFGLVNFCLDFFRGDRRVLFISLTTTQVLALISFFLGFMLYYRLSKRSLTGDLQTLKDLLLDGSVRKSYLLKLNKSWYNRKVKFKFIFNKILKNVKVGLNVKSNPTKF